jgi:hypothetical protein
VQFNEKELRDIEYGAAHRYELQRDIDAPIIEQVVPHYECQWDFDKNDDMKRHLMVQRKLREIGYKVVYQNRLTERLGKIKNFLKGAKTRAEVRQMVNLDYQRAEYAGIGKKGNKILFYCFSNKI